MKLGEGKLKAPATRYRLDDLVIDTGARCVLRNGVDLGITGLSFDLLLALGQAAPDLLSTDELVERVWSGQVVSTETITQRVKLLRQSLGDQAGDPHYIESRRGHGYRIKFAMTVAAAGSKSLSDAQELYLQARAVMRGTHESRDHAVALLDRALRLERDFAAALGHRALLVAGSVALSGAPTAQFERASADARRALHLDASLPDAHVALALIGAHRRDWITVEEHFASARTRAPLDPLIRNMHCLNALRPTGRVREALRQLVETYRLAPDEGFTAHELALTHSILGSDPEALRFADLARALAGISAPHWDVMLVHARAHARGGRFEEAASCAAQSLPAALRNEGGGGAMAVFYSGLAHPLQRGVARTSLLRFSPKLHSVGVDGRARMSFVSAFAMLGALDDAYELLDQFLRSPLDSHVTVDLSELWLPEMKAFRADPRWHDLAARLGLTACWQKFGPPDDLAA